MTSKLAVLTLMCMLNTTTANGASWVSKPVEPRDGEIILQFGKNINCFGNWMDVTKYQSYWQSDATTRFCVSYDRYQHGTRYGYGPCNTTVRWEYDGTRVSLSTTSGNLWYCPYDGKFRDSTDGTTLGEYRSRGWVNSANHFELSKTIINIIDNGNGNWRTDELTLKGTNLKRITISSSRDVQVNLGDEELILTKNATAEIPPPKHGNRHTSFLKLFFHGHVTDTGTTTYNISLTATFF